MEQLLLTIAVLGTCLVFMGLGLILSGKPLKKSCSAVPGQSLESCLCESTKDPNACSGKISEESLVAAIRKVKAES